MKPNAPHLVADEGDGGDGGDVDMVKMMMALWGGWRMWWWFKRWRRRVVASGVVDRVDRVKGSTFGFAHRKSFSAAVVAGGGRLVAENNGGKSMRLSGLKGLHYLWDKVIQVETA
nr:hypothetical protein [Tanacetum cinerariifolium]